MILSGKKILVAGAGGLLGSTLVRDLLREGAVVIAADINVDQMLSRLSEHGVSLDADKVQPVQCNVTVKLEVEALFAESDDLAGAVNTTYPRNKLYGAHFFDVTPESFNENMNLHLGSAFLFSQQAAEYFRRNQNIFSLVNISSIYGVIAPRFNIYDGTPMTMPVEYAAIKSAIIQLSKYVASYLNDTRFRVNCVSPGGIYDGQPEAFLNAYKAQTFGAGMLRVEDITGSIIYLLSDQARYVTGQNIIVDDGFSI